MTNLTNLNQKCDRILSGTDKQMQVQAKLNGILYNQGRKLGAHYPDLEPDNELWIQITGSCYKSLVYSIQCNACKQYTQTLKITGNLQHSVY